MRVAAIYDIHANLPALEAVLKEIHGEGVDLIVVGGDVVPGPIPRASVSTLLGLSVPVQFIQGNGDRDVLRARAGEDLTRVPERFHDVMRWVAKELTPEQVVEIASWPPTLTLDVAGIGKVVFCHATPRDDNEIFTRITPERRLESMFRATGADLVVCGHTHMHFDRIIGGVRVVNAGSVGMPFGEPGAYWLLLDTEVELRRTEYDLTEATRLFQETEYPRVSEFELLHPASESQMLDVFEAAARTL